MPCVCLSTLSLPALPFPQEAWHAIANGSHCAHPIITQHGGNSSPYPHPATPSSTTPKQRRWTRPAGGVAFQGTAEAGENLTNASARLLLEYVGHQQRQATATTRKEDFDRLAFYTDLLPPALRAQTMPELRVVGFPEFTRDAP